MTSSKLLSILRDFALEYHHAKFGGNWATNKGKTEGDIVPPAYMVPKSCSLNRVNHISTWGGVFNPPIWFLPVTFLFLSLFPPNLVTFPKI